MDAYRRTDWAGCASEFAKAGALMDQDGSDFVSAACCAARAGKADAAVELLQKALKQGYRDTHELEIDEDLATLRSRADWLELVVASASNARRYEAAINSELRDLKTADQTDRQGMINWERVKPRDAKRINRVHTLLAQSALHEPDDFINAAVILNHSDDLLDIVRAHELALHAAEISPTNFMARALAGATEDRVLVSTTALNGCPSDHADAARGGMRGQARVS